MKVQKIVLIMGMMAALLLSGCGDKAEQSALKKGMTAIEEMDYQTALLEFDKAEEAGEDARLVLRGRGIANMGMTDYEAAVQYFLGCIALSDGVVEEVDYDVNYYLAACYQKMGRFGESVKVYDAILSMRPGEVDAYYLRGNSYLLLGNYEKARLDFDQVVKREPNNYDRLIRIYEALRAEGYKDMGDEYLNAALNERADKMSSYEKGRIQYYLEDYRNAQISLEEAKSAKGADADTYMYLGMAYEATGDYNYAITNVYTAYLNQNEGNAALYNQLGLCYIKQEQYQAALEAFQSAMQLEGNGMMQTLRFNEIVAYEYLNNYEQAGVLLEHYLQLYPDDERAKREYGFLSTR